MYSKILTVKDLNVKFKDSKKYVLKNVNFELNSGDVLCIDGLNGSGKSTLLKIIFGETGDYIIESGEIIYHSFMEKNILTFNKKEMLEYHSKMGYVPQRDNYEGLNRLTIEDLINDCVSTISTKRSCIIDQFNIYFKENNRISLKSIPSRLSGGEQRMISIFLGLVCKDSTNLMIIDEPLNNLDFDNILKVSDLLNSIHKSNPNSGMIIVTHCKIITCVNRRRVIQNGTIEKKDSQYVCHHCIGEPDCNMYYLKKNNLNLADQNKEK